MRLSKRSRLGVIALLAPLVITAGCGDTDDSAGGTTITDEPTTESVPVPDGIVVGAGINDPDDPNIAVLQFMPAALSVEVDTPVTWEWSGTEPHSVTFLPEGLELPAPGTPEEQALFGPTPATGAYDGSALVNSGLQPLGPTAPTPLELSFAAAGTYEYYCVIHPTMVGEVTVEEAGGDVDTPADVAERRAAEQEEWLAEGRAAKAELMEQDPVKTENADGTTTWTVEMGTTTPHVDILAFAPTPAEVSPGDTVTFVNRSGAPHTASFFGAGAEAIDNPLDPRVSAPAPGASPQPLSSKGFFNTGLLPPDAPPGAGPPEAVRTFSFTVQDAGSYAYVCILHAPSAMIGSITAS
jgi:plastocyanin